MPLIHPFTHLHTHSHTHTHTHSLTHTHTHTHTHTPTVKGFHAGHQLAHWEQLGGGGQPRWGIEPATSWANPAPYGADGNVWDYEAPPHVSGWTREWWHDRNTTKEFHIFRKTISKKAFRNKNINITRQLWINNKSAKTLHIKIYETPCS